MYFATKIISLVLAISGASFAAPAPIPAPAPPNATTVGVAVEEFINDVSIVSQSLDSLVQIKNSPAVNDNVTATVEFLAEDIQNAETDGANQQAIIFSAAQQKDPDAAKDLNAGITRRVRGNTGSAPTSESFLGRLQDILKNPDADFVSGVAVFMGEQRNGNILPDIKSLIELALQATDQDTDLNGQPIDINLETSLVF
ncbi:hypothetical protein HYFRA_00011544 [Hymenoscyphus fraxineus]|uniref:Cell wall protein n=1 Tax=Hymenoscyphus fraxineus TaxID=746836 RepID=A0A9N9PYH9_9HELO|nr:hypothetical protein HYFRA_00011544 [Hymenoscyphus fraxineus]